MGKSGKGGKGGKGGGASAALLTPDGDLTPGFQAALHAIFARFDAGGDGALDDGELNAFAAACNDGEPFSADELEEVKARRACPPLHACACALRVHACVPDARVCARCGSRCWTATLRGG
jgi:hypothetical protein